jgi:hypothetical protein
MELKLGSRWRSAVCDTEIAIVRPPKLSVTLECGGRAVIAIDAARPAGVAVATEYASGTLLGKRYMDAACGLELLCTKGGVGSLLVDGRAMTVKEAKRLPSSD